MLDCFFIKASHFLQAIRILLQIQIVARLIVKTVAENWLQITSGVYLKMIHKVEAV